MPQALTFPRAQPHPGDAISLPGVRLRPARTADLPFLRQLYRAGREAELEALGWPETARRDFCRSQFEAQHLDYTRRFPSALFLVLEQRRQPVGRLTVDPSGDGLHLIDIALLPAVQGQGTGTAVLLALQDWGRAIQKPVTLHVLRSNSRAAGLYRRLGFLRVAAEATHDQYCWHPPVA